MFLSDVSIKRPVFATMINLVLIVFGVFSYSKIGIDQFPEVDFPVVTVQVVYPGADPKTIEQKVLEPLEKGLTGVEGLETLNATAQPNVGIIVLMFKLEKNSDKAAQDVREKVSALASLMPAEAKAPVVSKFDITGAPILNLAVSSKTIPYGKLSQIAEDQIRPALEQVQGVGKVEIVGLRPREIHVRLDREKLVGFGLSPQQVAAAIQQQNLDIPSGRVESTQSLLRIRTEGTLKSAQEIAKIVVPLRSGQKIRVEDLAKVSDTIADEETYATKDSAPALVLAAYKASGGNTVAIADNAKATIAKLKTLMSKDVELEIVTDNSKFIRGSIDSVKLDLALGAILAIAIVLFFLHDWRATFISAVAIPTSVIATFAFVKYMNFTLNIMTTLGLTLSIGILVDDAIVVIENIYRRIELGETPAEAARKGTSEIGMAALAITLSIVAVFVPVAFMDGIIGRFFYQFGMTVTFSVLISLFVAFTLTPMMSSRLLKAHSHKPAIFRPIENMLLSVERGYAKLLRAALTHRWLTLGAGLGFFVLSIFLLKFVPVAFLPPEDRAQFAITYQLTEGSPLSVMKAKAAEVDRTLRAYPGVKNVVMTIGANSGKKPNLARFDINLVEKGDRSYSQAQIVNRLRNDLKPLYAVDGAKFELSESSGPGGGRSNPIQIIMRSNDYEQLKKFASEIKDFAATVPGVVDADTSAPPEEEELRVVVDPVLAADVGLSSSQVGLTLRSFFENTKVGEIEDAGKRFDVQMRMDSGDSRDKSDLLGLYITNNLGQPISISSVAKINVSKAPSKIERSGGQRQVVMFTNFTGKDLRGAVNAILGEAQKRAPEGITLALEGEAKRQQESAASFSSALLLAILLVYMVLCAQFEGYITPFVIMMSVPLAFSGAFAGLLITGKVLSIYAMIGLIMLMGLVTKNAILLIDFTLTQMREEGHSVFDALMKAGPVRLRPILMTTAAMIFGMLPIAIGHGEGGEARAPMAVAVIGGLISSTLLTLVVVPCVFSLVEAGKARLTRKHRMSVKAPAV